LGKGEQAVSAEIEDFLDRLEGRMRAHPDRILSIAAAQGWFAQYTAADGGFEYEPVVCFALGEYEHPDSGVLIQDVYPMVRIDAGDIVLAEFDTAQYVELVHVSSLPPTERARWG